VVEAVSFQKALARDERLERMRTECGFTIVEHQTNINKSDETFGVARMASSYIDQTIQIPWAGEAEREMFQPFIDEHTQWRASIPTRLRVQDYVMSAWFPWMQWQRLRESERQQTLVIKGEGLPFRATAHRQIFEYRGSVLGGRR
jgi:hypothetical protein